MKTENLESIAKKLVAPGKGILAADESSGTIEKRLKEHQRSFDGRKPAGIPRNLIYHKRRGRIYQRRNSFRRDDSAEDSRRAHLRKGAGRAGDHPWDQGRRGRQGNGEFSGRKNY